MSLQANEDCQHPSESDCCCGMKPFQARVIVEKHELDDKRYRLMNFLATNANTLHPEERDRLNRQLDLMRQYSGVLAERIAAFQ